MFRAIDLLREKGAMCSQRRGFAELIESYQNADGNHGRHTWTCPYPVSLRPQNQRFRTDGDLPMMLPSKLRAPVHRPVRVLNSEAFSPHLYVDAVVRIRACSGLEVDFISVNLQKEGHFGSSLRQCGFPPMKLCLFPQTTL